MSKCLVTVLTLSMVRDVHGRVNNISSLTSLLCWYNFILFSRFLPVSEVGFEMLLQTFRWEIFVAWFDRFLTYMWQHQRWIGRTNEMDEALYVNFMSSSGKKTPMIWTCQKIEIKRVYVYINIQTNNKGLLGPIKIFGWFTSSVINWLMILKRLITTSQVFKLLSTIIFGHVWDAEMTRALSGKNYLSTNINSIWWDEKEVHIGVHRNLNCVLRHFAFRML